MTNMRLSRWAVPLVILLTGVVLLGCKPSTPATATDVAPANAVVPVAAPQVEAVEPVVTEETGSPKGKVLAQEEGCERAREVLATCASETSCSAEMTMFLPSASRSQYVLLTAQAWFSEHQFDGYCERACNARSAEVDLVAFEKEVCSAASTATMEKAAGSGIVLTVNGIAMPTEGIALDQLMAKLGKPERIVGSRYTCDSAFEEEGVQEYVYPNATFETDGNTAVLRSMSVSGPNQLALPGVASATGYAESDFQKLPGIKVEPLKDHVYRTSTVPGGDLETAYDFTFSGGKLSEVEYWIGC